MHVLNIGDNYYEKTYNFLVDIVILIIVGRVYCKCCKYSLLLPYTKEVDL